MAILHVVTDDQYRVIDRRMREIKRQLDQNGGSPLAPDRVAAMLQLIVEGKFDPSDDVAGWEKFYRELFGLEVDFVSLSIPSRKKGFERLVVVVPGMTPQRLYNKCTELFQCWKQPMQSLDEVVRSERTAADGPYAVWFRDTVEADKDLKGFSANVLKKKGVPYITLEERLLMELKYFKETGNHLDWESVTLCSGSRFSDGHVPRVFWDNGKLTVFWSSDPCSDYLRARRAVL